MAFIKCPACKKKIDDDASTCPNCEYTLTPEIILEIKQQEKQLSKTGCIGCLAIIAMLLVLFFIGALASKKTDDAKVTTPSEKIILESPKPVTVPLSSKTESPPDVANLVSSKHPFEQLQVQMTRTQVNNIFGHDGVLIGGEQGYDSLEYKLPSGQSAVCVFFGDALYSWDYGQNARISQPVSNEVLGLVHVTEKGEKYHHENCRTLNRSEQIYSMTRVDAIGQKYGACKVCNP